MTPLLLGGILENRGDGLIIDDIMTDAIHPGGKKPMHFFKALLAQLWILLAVAAPTAAGDSALDIKLHAVF